VGTPQIQLGGILEKSFFECTGFIHPKTLGQMPKTQPLELRPVTETFSMHGPDDVARVLLEYCWDRPSAARTQAVVPLKAAPLREAGPAQDRRFTARNSRVDHIYIFTTVSPTSPNAIMSLSTFRSSFLRSCQVRHSLSDILFSSVVDTHTFPMILLLAGTPCHIKF
jgi:hypothetical protein